MCEQMVVRTTICSHIHTPTVESTTQGDSQLTGSGQGEASRSGTPRHTSTLAGDGDRTSNPPVTSQTALPPQLLPPLFHPAFTQNDSARSRYRGGRVSLHKVAHGSGCGPRGWNPVPLWLGVKRPQRPAPVPVLPGSPGPPSISNANSGGDYKRNIHR